MAKILVIDDDGVVRDALEVFLTRAGHRVATAADGAQGVLAFEQNRPDVVVLDRELPVLTGSGVLKRIRELSPGVPVIVLTGYDAPEDAESYLRAGATAFLSKKDGLLNALMEVDRVLGAEKRPAPPAAPAPRAAAGPGGKALVLVADDDAQMLQPVSRFLLSYGYDVVLAEDGDRALELARARRPDIALLDISMPGTDGVEVLRALAPELPGCGFIMLTGNEDEGVAKACLKIGAFDYLTKPANLGALESVIRSCLQAAVKR